MHLALEAVGVKAGDKVVTTPYTFAATAEVIRYFGADPVFVDVQADTLNLDVARVAEVVKRQRSPRSCPVHIAGEPCDMDGLRAAAGGIPIVEDAAHALPRHVRRQARRRAVRVHLLLVLRRPRRCPRARAACSPPTTTRPPSAVAS